MGFLCWIQNLKELLTTINPEWLNAQNFGRWTGSIPKTIKQFEEKNGSFFVPRGLLEHITEDLGQSWTIVDERVAPQSEKIWPEGTVVLREGDQEPAVQLTLAKDNGFLVAPAGSGKTVMGIEICRRLGLSSLWLTHTKNLKDQAIESVEELFHIPRKKIGELHGNKWRVGEQFTVGMIPTLRKRDLSEIEKEFGVVVVDEAHHVPSSTFLNVVSKFHAKHIYGLTATAYRRDQLEPIMFNAIGPKVAEIEHEELFEDEHLMLPSIRRVRTGWCPAKSEEMEYNDFMEAMVTNDRRNQLIVDQIIRECKNPRNTLAVLVERTKHCEILTALLKSRGVSCEFLVSSVDIEPKKGSDKRRKRIIPKKVREKIVSDFKSGMIQVLVATYDMLYEGFNHRPLNRLFLATPVKWRGSVVQALGRIQRPLEGKIDSIAYDYIDEKIAMFIKQADVRLSDVYKEMGMPVTDY